MPLDAPVAISPELLYSAKTIRASLGIGDHAWRQLKTLGRMQVIICSGREYVRGLALIEAMETADAKRRGAGR